MVKIIYGPPCAGKSTYVQSVRADADVVIDYDLIARALGATVAHGSSGSIRSVAFVVREAAINTALKGVDDDAYIIHTNPLAESVEKYKSAGAEFILIDPGIDVCLERAKNRPKDTASAVEKWYASPPDIKPNLVVGAKKKSGVVYLNPRANNATAP
jgi:predicted kinase